MSFQSTLKSIYKTNVLGGFFSEPVTFTPIETGVARSVTMSVTHRQERKESETSEDNFEYFECEFLTDESDEDVGGIDVLQLQDSFVRSSTYDSNSAAIVFAGNILERGRHYIRAEFQRYKRVAQGRGR